MTHPRASSQAPSSSRQTDCAMEVVSPTVSGRDALGPNVKKAWLREARRIAAKPMWDAKPFWRTVLLAGAAGWLFELSFVVSDLVSNPTISTLLRHLILVIAIAAIAAMA